jgi:hypothetical protein
MWLASISPHKCADFFIMNCNALQEAAKAAAAKKAEEERIAAIEQARIEAEKKQAAEVS